MIIELSENTGIRNIKQFYFQLKNSIEGGSEVIIDFSKIRRLDLSVLQVIMAARKKMRDDKKDIIFKSASKEVNKQLYLGGLLE